MNSKIDLDNFRVKENLLSMTFISKKVYAVIDIYDNKPEVMGERRKEKTIIFESICIFWHIRTAIPVLSGQ